MMFVNLAEESSTIAFHQLHRILTGYWKLQPVSLPIVSSVQRPTCPFKIPYCVTLCSLKLM
jgi:hypothetical protein